MSLSIVAPLVAVEEPLVRFAAEARLPSRFGEYHVVAFDSVDGKEHAAILKGDVRGADDVPLRVHSECFTGDVMGSLKCDCRDQLEAALTYIASVERGAVLYLRQEGRGIGLANKIRAYALQEKGFDTVEANEALGFEADSRDYRVGVQILRDLGVKSTRLLSNNPLKLSGVTGDGLSVTERLPIEIPASAWNGQYLKTKKEKLGHQLTML